MSMVDYIKQNLSKLTFDTRLFIKELEKSRRWLTLDEWEVLMEWVRDFHGDKIHGVDVKYHAHTNSGHHHNNF